MYLIKKSKVILEKKWMELVSIFLISGFSLLYASPDLGAVLDKVSKYDYGKSRECLTELNEMVLESLNSPDTQKKMEQKLIEILNSDATFAAKQFICTELSLIGSQSAVPALIKLLENEKTLNISLFALQRIPADNVNEQLRLVLAKATGNKQIAIINTLGERKDKDAIRLIEKNLNSADSQLAITCAAALGKIAGDDARNALKNALAKTDNDVRMSVLDAYLLCADLYSNQPVKALEIYNEVFAANYPSHIRSAALTGIVRTSGNSSIGTLLKTIKEGKVPLQSVAISLIRELPADSDLNTLTMEFSGLSPSLKIQMLAALADRKDVAGRGLALQVTDNEDQALRIAAIKSLTVLGNENDVLLLAGIAAKSKGSEKESARQCLAQLNGKNVDQIILSKIPDSDAAVKAELIHSIGRRNVQNAVDLLFETIHDPQQMVQKESYESLSIVAGVDDFERIIELLLNPKYAANLLRSKSLAVKVALKEADSDVPVNFIIDNLSATDDVEIKNTLLNILGKTGNIKALQVIRTMLADNNAKIKSAAVSALTVWPNAEPLNDLLDIVQKKASEEDKRVALRGYIRLIGIDDNLSSDEKVHLYKNAMQYAEEINEQRMVITGLGEIETIRSMDLLISYLDREVLKIEIQNALLNIATETARIDLEKTKMVLSQIINTTVNDQQREIARTLLNHINEE